MMPAHPRSRPASLAAFLALIWLLWTGLDAYRAILAQRYLELGYTHLTMLALRGATLHMLPHLLLALPGTLLVLRLLRRRRTLAPALFGLLSFILYAANFGRIDTLLRAVMDGRITRLVSLGLILAAALGGGAALGHLLGRRGWPGRICARAAERIDAVSLALRSWRFARILGHRAMLLAALAGGILSLTLPLITRPADVRGPSVVILLIDTLRADHLGCYGYGRETSPNIDRWAGEAIVFDQAIAQASWTKPSVASLFTSLYPTVHRTGGGMHARREVRAGKIEMVPAPADAPGTSAKLPPGIVTIAEVFREAGYRTAGFIANALIGRDFRYGQGFETYAFGGDLQVTSGAMRWLERHGEEPFFLYLHYMAPHAPYDPPEAFDRFTAEGDLIDIQSGEMKDQINFTRTRTLSSDDVNNLIDQYDGEILFSDDQCARVLAELEKLGLRDQTVVILTSDHGEEFLEHGMVWHESIHLYDELVRIPLVIDLPGEDNAGRRTKAPIMQIDLGPTLFELAHLRTPAEMQGRSFAPLLRGEAYSAHAAYTETIDWGFKQAIRIGGRKLILDRDTGGMELFDLHCDPGERDPTLDLPGQELKALHDSLEAQYARNLGILDPEAMGLEMGLSEEQYERLRSLGYLQ